MNATRHSDLDGRTPFSAKLTLSVIFVLFTAIGAFAIARGSALTFTLQKWAYGVGFSAVLSGLLVAVLYTLLPAQRFRQPVRSAAFYPLLAGVLGFLCMALSYIWLGVWPFGEESVMVVDMHHQYAPLLSELRDMLLHGGNPLYTFHTGIGANFVSQFAYYLASPFNLLLVLFPPRLLTEAILVITLLKNTLTAILFAACLQYVLRRRDLSVSILAVCYSMSMYLLAYSWNIMWLDAVMLLPLVVLGFERMMRTGKYGVYVLSLAYILFTNYYIGFMVCVFLVLYYLAFALRRKRSAHAQRRAFLRFSLGSLIGGGLAMCILIPVLYALRYTSAAGETLPEITSNFSLIKIFGRQLFGTSPTIRSGNLPNIYCGILPLILLPLFFTTRTIPVRRRLAYGGLLGVLALSFTVNWMDLTWHGFHAPNDLPYRFSFLFIFAVLLIAAMLLPHLREITARQIGGTLAGLAAFIVIYETQAAHNGDLFVPVYASLLLLVIYSALLLLISRRRLLLRTGYTVLTLVVTVELLLHGAMTFDALNQTEYFTDHSGYVDNAETVAVQNAVSTMNTLADAENKNGFYRAELLPRRTCVDTALFHYRGLTSFSSSNYYHTTRLLGNLGYAVNGINSYLYQSFVPAADSLLGIRYVALNTAITNHPQLEKIGESGSYSIYRNKLSLPVAYRVSDAVQSVTASRFNPFATQESLLAAMTGDDRPVYTALPLAVMPESVQGASVYDTQISVNDTNGPALFSSTVTAAGSYYVYLDCSAADSATVMSYLPDGAADNTWEASLNEPYIIDAGVLQPGSQLQVSITTDEIVSGNFYVMRQDNAVLQEKLTALAAGGMQVTSASDSCITGTVNVAENGVLFTSIPYDAGWTLQVDGKSVECYPVGDLSDNASMGAFLAADIGAGQHEISFRFVPQGLWIGLALSGISLLAFLLLLLITNHRRPAAQENEQPPAEPEPLPPAVAAETLSESVTLGDLLETPSAPLPESDDSPQT